MNLRRVVCWLLVFASGVGAALGTYLRATGHEMAGSIFDLFPFLIGVALASLLVVRVPDNNMTFVLCVALASGTWVDLDPPLRAQALENGNETLAIVLAQAGTGVFYLFYVSLFILLPLWFPTGRPPNRRWEWVQQLAMTSVSVAMLLTAFSAETCVRFGDDCQLILATPWGVVAQGAEWADRVFLIGAIMALPAVWSLVVRFRGSRGVERQQLKSMVPSMVLIAVFFLAQRISEEGFGFDLFADQLMWIIVTLTLASFSLAILRYRLYEIDRIISRTIGYAIVLGVLIGVVALVATLVGTRFESPLVVAAVTLGVAAAFSPLRRWVQRGVDRHFNRSSYDAERVMDDFARSLRDEVDEVAVVDGWQGVVVETMQPSALSVWVRE